MYFFWRKYFSNCIGNWFCCLWDPAVNYSLHLFNHHRHKRDIREVLNDLSMPLTVGEFYNYRWIFLSAIREVWNVTWPRLFTAFSLIGASLSTLIFLLHLIGSGNDTEIWEKSRSRLDAWSDFGLHHNKLLIGLIVLLTIVLGIHRVMSVWSRHDEDELHEGRSSQSGSGEFNRLNAFSSSLYIWCRRKNRSGLVKQWAGTRIKLNSYRKPGGEKNIRESRLWLFRFSSTAKD